ncbi:MAG: type II secretion system F family protein [Burkholderiaceae bacterium]
MAAVHSYFYRVLLPHGAMQRGLLRLAVERELSARLRLEAQTDGTVITLWRLPNWLAFVVDWLARLFRNRLRDEDLVGFLRDLGLMMGAGVPAMEALRTLVDEGEQGNQRAVAQLARHIRDDLNGGVGLTESFNRHPDVFPETVRNLVAIGEQSGTMDRMLREAAEHVERMIHIRRDIRTALIYPAFVFATIIGVAFFWIYYVVPNMARLFKQLQAKLPPITVALVDFADLVTTHLPWLTLAVALLVIVAVVAFRQSERVQLLTYSVMHRVPIIRNLLTCSGMAHITEHLAILVRAGLDLMASLHTLSRATKDRYYRVRLEQVAAAVGRGESVAQSMRRVGGFPAMAVRMVAVGEEAGSLDEQLQHLANEYRKRLDVLVRSLAEIFKPVIILIAGGMFIFLIVALLLPIYDLVRQTVAQSLG